MLHVREPEKYEKGHIPGAVLIYLSELPGQISEIGSYKSVLAY
ncbi:MAG: rhodanese-like domain-containing protein [Syntrophobacterales bacterium]|nr:MAG: rhodanese-like domain-containing protein [Syntrophobacterales bacterium]